MPIEDGVRFLNREFKKALILEDPDPSLDEYLRAQGIEPDRLPKSMTQDIDAILDRLAMGQHDLMYKRSKFEVDDRVLTASGNLAAVMLCCIGDDSVDKAACARHGVLVMNDPVSNGRSVVEMVFGEMLCLARRIFDANDASHHNTWTKDNDRRYELKGKTLGIVGLGNIGKQVAQVAEAFGMEICFWDDRELAREVGAALGWRVCESILDVFKTSDCVTLHVSSQDSQGRSNKNLITPDHFAAFAQDRSENSPRILINAGRGFLFEPAALRQAIQAGHVRAAAIDVFPEEPGSAKDKWENPYADLPQVVTTPHIGAATEEAQPRIASYVAKTTKRYNAAATVRSCVFAPGHVIGVNTERSCHLLAVVHSDARGTKKAISDSIFDAGINNTESSHLDFLDYGIAYDISAMDKALSIDQLHLLVENARRISGDPTAIRAIRQVSLGC